MMIDDDSIFDYENLLQEVLVESIVQSLTKDDNSSSFENDVYMKYRKVAFKMERMAKSLCEDSKKAYSRSDYISANDLYQKSELAWQIVDKLHEKAAKKIFEIKNQKNGLMKIDLHGLHPSEAVEATRKRLSMIETNKTIISNSSTSSNKKSNCLKVITGVGKHSRNGVAKIPTAVKTFLTYKGYEFFESMPGVITVRLKFSAD